jgi:hypothetical protein
MILLISACHVAGMTDTQLFFLPFVSSFFSFTLSTSFFFFFLYSVFLPDTYFIDIIC